MSLPQISYRTCNFLDDIIYSIANTLGIDTQFDLLKDHARAWSSCIDTRLRYAWELWDWPELEVTEERAFRQVWHSDVSYQGSQGDNSEVYSTANKTYYRAYGHPPPGSAPNPNANTTDDGWNPITLDQLDKHIAFEQYGKQAIGQIYGVFSASPRTGIPVIQWTTAPSGLGIDVAFYSGPTVWITYKPRQPKFTTNTYSRDIVYARGNVVLDLDSGDCYLALQACQDKALTDSGYWLVQEFPYAFSEYVVSAVASDMADDIIAQRSLMQQADEFLYREMDKNIEQGQRHYYRNPNRGFRLPLGTSAYYRNLYQYVT